MENLWKQVRRMCVNCGQELIGYQNEKGLVKMQCSRCGIVMVSKRMSRRHEHIDVTPPSGEYFKI